MSETDAEEVEDAHLAFHASTACRRWDLVEQTLMGTVEEEPRDTGRLLRRRIEVGKSDRRRFHSEISQQLESSR